MSDMLEELIITKRCSTSSRIAFEPHSSRGKVPNNLRVRPPSGYTCVNGTVYGFLHMRGIIPDAQLETEEIA